jgi:hypothetical protein
MKDACERCSAPLAADAEAFACTFECTFCRACTLALALRCPNCGGLLCDRRRAAVIVATATEALAVRRLMPDVRVYETGIALQKHAGPFGGAVVSCGLAGGLRRDVPSGTVLVPREVRRPDGSALHCDDALTAKLAQSARRLGFEPVCDPLLTSSSIVNGSDRETWAGAGFAGVDMETGLIEAERIAAVRVVLDTPQRELSAEWLVPARALARPRNWPQAFWLARNAPRFARRAAAVVAAARV